MKWSLVSMRANYLQYLQFKMSKLIIIGDENLGFKYQPPIALPIHDTNLSYPNSSCCLWPTTSQKVGALLKAYSYIGQKLR